MRTNNKHYKNILLLVFFIVISFSIYGQGTIKTPKNQTIYLINDWDDSSPDLIATWEAQAANWIDINDSEADKKAPATSNYNCHAYAWHISDGGDDEDSWINYDIFGIPNVSKYWTNDAYSTVSSIGDHTKIFYGINADHSAISQSSSNLVISKWGWWGLYEHALTDCPFSDGASYTFYSVPLNGDDFVCTSKTYSTVNISSATYNWSSYKVSINGTGYSESATKTSNGFGWVQTEISSPYSGTTITTEKKSIYVGRPADTVQLLGYDELCPMGDDEDNFLVAYPPDEMSVTDYQWTFPSEWTFTTGQGTDTPEFTIYDDFTDEHVQAYLTNQCGTTLYDWIVYQDDDCPDGYYMSFSPNPTTGETTLSIESTLAEKTFGANTEWEVEVYSPSQIIKKKTGRLKGTSTKLQTAGWQDGVYVVRVKYYPKGKSVKILTGKLVVKR